MFSKTVPSWVIHIPCPLLVVALDDGRVLFANRRAGQELGAAVAPGMEVTAVLDDPVDLAWLLKGLPEAGRIANARLCFRGQGGKLLTARCDAELAEVEGRDCAVIILGEPEQPAQDTVEAELRFNRALWRAVFDQASVGIVLMDKDCRFLDANRHWQELFGYNTEELRTLRPAQITQNEDPSRPTTKISALLRGEIEQYRTEKCYVRRDGTPFWGDLSVSVLRDDEGLPVFVMGFLVDISERKQAVEQLHEMNEQLEVQLLENQKLQERLSDLAVRDPLTGLYNRRYMEETLRRELSRSAREFIPLSLVIMDIDHFKRLNDTHGHPAGDHVLKELAGMLHQQMRREDVACRFGGEEFIAILPGAPLTVAAERAESWRRQFETLQLVYEGTTMCCTLSLGIAEFPRHGGTGEELLFQADAALYAAKRAGRNRVVAWG